jgi:hypothetical protein
MMKLRFCTSLPLLLASLTVHAGNLGNGQWNATNCGAKPPAPPIKTNSVDAFNQSIKAINAWQTKAQEYYNCVVKEANADNEAIAQSANAAQEEFKREVARIQQEADAGKAKVEKN